MLWVVILAASAAAPGFAEEPFEPSGVEGCAFVGATDPHQQKQQSPLVFVGSSSIARWDSLARDLGESAVRCGYWGKQTADMIPRAEPIAAFYQPRRIFYYAGDNDLADQPPKTAQEVLENFRRFVEKVRAVPSAAHTSVTFLSIKESPARWELRDRIVETNLKICRYTEKDSTLDFIDVFDALLTDDHSAPNTSLFQEDGLHLNEAGYKRWGRIIRRWMAPDERFVSAHGCSWLEYVSGKSATTK